MIYSLKEVLIKRDGLTNQQADQYIIELKSRIEQGQSIQDILYQELCLQKDYIFNLME